MATHHDENLQEPCGLTYDKLRRMSDEDLMVHLAAGHGDAVAVLLDRYSRLALSIASNIVRDDAEAEDLVQEIFVELCRTAAQFNPEKGTAKMWIVRTVYRRSFNRRRQIKLRLSHLQPDYGEVENGVSGQNLAPCAMAPVESRRFVLQMLRSLDYPQRRVLELLYFEGLSMHDVAEKTGDSFASVRHRYYRGMKKLRELIEKKNRREPRTASQETLDAKA